MPSIAKLSWIPTNKYTLKERKRRFIIIDNFLKAVMVALPKDHIDLYNQRRMADEGPKKFKFGPVKQYQWLKKKKAEGIKMSLEKIEKMFESHA